ncbi:Cancer-related nucleoside-triphosphatase like [Pseudolycoriella hygida]|uniref:Cancer-related nucleoside-triphosphatase like n=1 Tax=Pseudolycoriella hygida TaxID=35572 RepID=A0A9Q0N2F6_9DIPT|nr:Cancer-related nucleoside-triphosphatase like [Pseudolycoriella hygida]
MSTFFVFITGAPGVGKTTIIKRLAEELRLTSDRVSGFYTEDVRNRRGKRIGFDVVTLDSLFRGVLARKDRTGITSKRKVGHFFVDTTTLDKLLLPIIASRDAVDILIIDEIGKMEVESDIFRKFISGIITTEEKSYKLVLATVPLVTSKRIVKKIRCVSNSKTFLVTKSNRTAIYDEIRTTVTADLLI